MTQLQEQIAKLLINNPKELRKFLANTENPKYVLSYIKKLMPYRTGVEIDIVGGNNAIMQKARNRVIVRRRRKVDDERCAKTLVSEEFEWEGSTHPRADERVEIKFSWWLYQSLGNIYTFLNEMKEDPTSFTNAAGGLHIHIDLERSLRGGSDHDVDIKREEARKRLISLFNYIKTKIFGIKEILNSDIKNNISFGGGGVPIAVMRNKDSIEYRMGTCTFNYSTIMKQVLCLQQINKSIRLKRPLDKELTDAILAL